jgi:PP-loop superfamily ATP-utilizing enzyme
VARLELEEASLGAALDPSTRRSIVELGKRQGFTFVALDLAGFTSGSLNQLVGLRRARP